MPDTTPCKLGVMIPELGMPDSDQALRYLLLHQNTLQKSFEFHVLPVVEDRIVDQLLPGQRVNRIEVEMAMPAFVRKCRDNYANLAEDFGLLPEPDLPILILSTATFTDNYFLTGGDDWAIIALGNWKRHMAPPSIIEFFLSFAVKVAIDTACGDQFPHRHTTTRGCSFDFAADLANARYSVLSGFLCTQCINTISLADSDQLAKDAQLLLKRQWLGTVAEPSDVSVTAKKLGYDLFHVKGITPTWWERTQAILEEEGVKTLLKIFAGVAVAALIFYFGLKSKS